MPRTRKFHLEFANFHCTAGPEKELIDIAESVALPAFFSGEKRYYGNAAYFFMNQALVELDGGELGISFELVKNTKIESQQKYERGKLKARIARIPDAPSSFVLLLFNSHRIVYLPKTLHAPTIRELQHTCELLFRIEREKRVHEEMEVLDRKRGVRARLNTELPRPHVKIVPLASAASLDEFFAKLKLVKSLRFELFQTNAEYDPDPLFVLAEERRKKLRADRAIIEQKGGKDGLDSENARKEVASATRQGTARVVVSGRDTHDEKVTQDNEEMRVRTEATFRVSKIPKKNAQDMADALAQHVAEGILAAPKVARDLRQRWRETIDRFRRER